MGKRASVFRKNGLDLEGVYINSGSLLNQGLSGGIQTVLDELSKEPKVWTSKFEDFVDMRALHELEREGVFK